MKMQIYNRPKKIGKSEYDIEIQKYSDRVAGAEGFVSLLSMGSVGAPGLSDIDLIAVVENEITVKEAQKFTVAGLREDLFLHGPVLIPRKCIKELNFIIYATNLNRILGESISEEVEQHEAEDPLLSLLYLVDFSESRFAQYAEVKRSKRIDQRSWMTRLWSITHTESLCNAAGLPISEKNRLVIQDIRQMRYDWLEGKLTSDQYFLKSFFSSEELLRDVFQDACGMAYDCLGQPDLPGRTSFIARNKRILCDPAITTPSVNVVKVRGHGALLSTTRLDTKYAAYLSHYGFDGAGTRTTLESPLMELMQKRSRSVRKLASFHMEKKINFSMGGYLGLPLMNSNLLSRFKFHVGWMLGV